MAATTTEDRVKPIVITDKDTGMTYELDFSRESVRFMESQGYQINQTFDLPNVNIPRLFYYAFRKNHKNIPLDKTEDLLNKMGGLTEKIAIRLVDLYRQATMSNNVLQSEEDLEKNSRVTVEL